MPKRPIRSLLVLAAWSSLTLPFPAPGVSAAPPVEWNDTSRDVYVGGDLEPGAVVLTAGAGAVRPRSPAAVPLTPIYSQPEASIP